MLKLIRALGSMTSLITVLLLGTGLLFVLQGKLIFHPSSTPPGNLETFSDYEIRLHSGSADLQGWMVRGEISERQPLILYFGGNAEEVSGNLRNLEGFGTDSFLFVNYRGYGKSSGEPSEKSLYADALFIYDWLINDQQLPPQHILLMGRSLGTAIATYLASQREVRGVVLVSPYDSMVALGRHHYPFLPVGWLLRHRFEAREMAPAVKVPLLAIIGESDRIIPPAHSDRLVASWGGPKQVVRLAGAGHNTLQNWPEYRPAIRDFIYSLAPR